MTMFQTIVSIFLLFMLGSSIVLLVLATVIGYRKRPTPAAPHGETQVYGYGCVYCKRILASRWWRVRA